MNGQINRLKTLISNNNFSFDNVYTFLSGSKSNGKSYILYRYANSLSKLKNVLIVETNNNKLNYITDIEIIDSFNKFDRFRYPKKGNTFLFNVSEDNLNNLEYFENILLKINNEFAGFFDLILINTISGVDKIFSPYFRKSQRCFLVSKTDPISIVDTYAVIKILINNNYLNDIQVIFNKVDSEVEFIEASDNLRKAVNHFLKREINIVCSIPTHQIGEEIVANFVEDFSLLPSY